jgi:hypothetical protein
MAGPFDFTGQNIENTYQRVLQTPDGTTFYDGTGSLVTLPSANTASLLTTASVSSNTITFTKGDGSTFPITVNTGSGGGSPTNTGSLLVTASAILNQITFTKGDTSQFTIIVDTGSATSIDTGSFVTTSSFNNFTSSYNTGSFTGSFTGIFNGTASWAYSSSQATSASYALSSSYSLSSSYALSSSYSTTASYASNGGVTQLLAGPNISLSPTNGLGQVTVSATLSGSTIFNTATGSYGSFYDTTTQTNPVANVPRSMSLNETDITNGVSISGSTNPFNTYIKTKNAGVYNIQFSAQVEKTDSGTDEIVIWLRKNGIDLTDTATTITLVGNSTKVVAAWNWFVTSAANDYYQIIWISADTSMRLLAEPISGTHPGIPSVILTVNRVDQFLSNTGSFTGSFTGELIGTASWAYSSSQATSASYALSSSYATSASYTLSSSYSLSSSLAESSSYSLSSSYSETASYALNGLPPGLSSQILQIDTSNQYQLQSQLNDLTGLLSVDFENRLLSYDGTTPALEYGKFGILYDPSGNKSIDFGTKREIYYSDGTTPAITYGTQDLIIISGSTQFSGSVFISGTLQGGGSGHIITYDTASGQLFYTASSAIGGGPSVSTGSLLTTASVSLNTITFTKGDGSTFPITVDTGSGGGGGVTQIIAGQNVTISPTSGTGSVTINSVANNSTKLFNYYNFM